MTILMEQDEGGISTSDKLDQLINPNSFIHQVFDHLYSKLWKLIKNRFSKQGRLYCAAHRDQIQRDQRCAPRGKVLSRDRSSRERVSQREFCIKICGRRSPLLDVVTQHPAGLWRLCVSLAERSARSEFNQAELWAHSAAQNPHRAQVEPSGERQIRCAPQVRVGSEFGKH